MAVNDRVVLVTGASGVLGRVVVAAFAGAGARLGLVGTDRGRLEEVASGAGLATGRWTPAVADLRDGAETARAVAEVGASLGPVEVVLHLVGGWSGGTRIADLDAAEVHGMLDQHLWTTLNVARAATPGMAERGWGRFIAISTPIAADGAAGMAAYAVAKAAEEALLRTLAREVGGAGVTVNVLVVRKIDEERERATAASPKNAGWTTPEEIAAALLYLCSDEAAAVNGVRLPLNGRS